MKPTQVDSPQACIDAIIERVGPRLVVGTPLAGGKPNHLLNALYARAKADPEIDLTLLTALTLERPKPTSDLQRRFLEPFVERVFGDYPDLDYELDRVAGALPENVRIIEFYFAPAKYLDDPRSQRNYISSNYTHAARDIFDRGCNVLLQQVADSPTGDGKVSFSCNPDLSADLVAQLRQHEAESGQPVAIAVQTNGNLPYMYGDAEIDASALDFIVRDPALDFTLFGPPKMAVTDAEHAIGLYVAALVRDDGELQVGIGQVADAVVSSLLLRHERNDVYRRALAAFEIAERFPEAVARIGGDDGPFERGLFSASEMVVDGFLTLFQRGVIKRRMYDDVHLQRLLNEGRIDEAVTPVMLDRLVDARAVHPFLTARDVDYLQHWGVFRADVAYDNGHLVLADGTRIPANMRDPDARLEVQRHVLGDQLKHGAVMHGGFFLGNQAFYEGLRNLSDADRRLIRMRSVRRINQLYGHEDIDRLHRRNARFVNTCMMVTLGGAAVSDGLEDGRVVSGVGGQYNFVDMAHALPDGHSILNLRATRTHHGQVQSNIVPSYGHITIPRHLRDVYVTEYGIAFVRGKTDEEIVQALLDIADSRFQPELMAAAKAAGKLREDYEIPERFRDNTPQALAARLKPLQADGHFPRFPLGCDFTPEELRLGKALKHLKAQVEARGGGVRAVLHSMTPIGDHSDLDPLLERMGLADPQSLEERVQRRLLISALRDTQEAPLKEN